MKSISIIKKCNDEIINNVDKYRKKMKGFDLPMFYNDIYNNVS